MNRIRLPSLPRYERDVWLLSGSSALIAGSFLGMMSLIKVLYVLRLGFGPEFVGSLYAMGSLSFMLTSLPAGALGGRYGARRMMIIGAVINIVGMSLLPFTEMVPLSLRTFWPLLVQVVSSMGWSLVMVNQIAAMMACTTVENRKGAYATREALAGLGIFTGVLVGGILPGLFAGMMGMTVDQPAPYRYALWVSVGMALTGLVPLIMIRPVAVVRSVGQGRKVMPPLMPLLLLAGAGFFNNGAVATCRAFGSAYLDRVFQLPPSMTGAVSSLGMALAVFLALSGPRLARHRRGNGQVMIVASFGLVGCLLLIGLVPHWSLAAVGIIGVLALAAMWMPAYQVLQMELAAPEWRAVIAGAASTSMSLGFGMVSFGGGYIVAAVGYQRLFLVGAVLALLSGLTMRYASRRAELPAPGPAAPDGQRI
jgi:predicted MFS family arabinose efflux permease